MELIRRAKNNISTRDSEYIALSGKIRHIFDAHGKECIADTEKFINLIIEQGIERGIAYQLGLVLELGNVKDFILRESTQLTLVDINNIVLHTQRETGLERSTIGNILCAIFEALGLPPEFTTAVIVKKQGYEEIPRGLVSEERHVKVLDEMESAIINSDKKKITLISEEFNQCVDAGIPRALYLKGLYYKQGLCGIVDNSLAMKYFEAASKSGYAKASAELGDIYLNKNIFTKNLKAFDCYTQVGAVGLSLKRVHLLKVILGEWERNKRQMVSFGILVLAILAYYFQLGSGSLDVSGETHWTISIIAGILSIAIAVLTYFANFTIKYINNRIFVTGLIIIATLTTIIAI